MQAMTHFAAGICAGTAAYSCINYFAHKHKTFPDKPLLRNVIIAVFLLLTALTHVLLDDIAKATYHPPDAMLDDMFWVVFHAAVLVVSIALFWFYRHFWLFMLASLTPDIDWAARIVSLWPEGSAHEFFRSLPLINSVSSGLQSQMPDWRFEPWAASVEIAILAFLLLISLLLMKLSAKKQHYLNT